MLIVLDTCNFGLTPDPQGGVAISLKGIEGLPNTTLMIPVAKESAEALHKALGDALHKVPTFDAQDLSKLRMR